MSKLKLWDQHRSWEEAECAWDKAAQSSRENHPLKTLKTLPSMPGMTSATAKHLKYKSLKYIISHDKERKILRHFLKHPLRYGTKFIQSFFKKASFAREGDFFLYGIPSVAAFEKLLSKKDTLLVVGFSYCQKPHECPSSRFTDECIHDLNNPVCQQCDIGKAVHALPDTNVIPLFIPTIHYIGDKIFELVHAHPDKKILFLITACELTLNMFSDLGNMVPIKGIGVRLEGRICNTMRAFELSEEGIKPGLTVVTPPTQKGILSLIKQFRESQSNASA